MAIKANLFLQVFVVVVLKERGENCDIDLIVDIIEINFSLSLSQFRNCGLGNLGTWGSISGPRA